jgi:methyl-accepting chemotaxis protein
MSLPTLDAPVVAGVPRRAALWGDRGVRTKVLAAVGVAALVAVVIGVLGLISLGTSAQRTQDLYDANFGGVTRALNMSGSIKDTAWPSGT